MVEFLIIIILLISIGILISTVDVLRILLGTIFIFIICSVLLALRGHVLIAGVFVIVYTGAILVMMCIAYLITPAVRDTKKFLNKTNKINTTDYVQNIILYFLFGLLIVSLFLVYLSVDTFTLIDNFKMSKINTTIFKDIINIKNIELTNFDKYSDVILIHNFKNFDIINPITTSFNILDLNYNNSLSINIKNSIIIFLGVGLYLHFTLLVCLRLFTITQKNKLIKRQDSVDQILKKWKK